MKPSTPANKRKSVGGDSIKFSNKKRKSFDSNEFVTKSNGIEESPITPTPVKKIKMFSGTSQLNSSVEGQQKSPKSPQSKKKLFKSPNVSNKKTELSESPVDVSKPKKVKGANENTDKAVKPNNGTDISPKKNKKQKKQKVTKEVISEFAGKKKKARSQFFLKLKDRARKDGKAVLADIESKISDIQNRKELTKTARRKLAFLKRMKHVIIEGGEIGGADKNVAQDSNQKQDKKQKSKKQKKQKPQQSVDKPKQVKNEAQEDSSSEEANNEDAESDSEEGVVTSKMLQGKVDQDMEDSDDEVGEEENDSEEEEDDAEAEGDKVEAESDESESEEGDSDVDTAEKKPSKIVSKKNQKEAKKVNQEKTIKKDSSFSSNKTTDSKHRYVLHVSNLPFDATEAEISAHFQKAGKVISVRIPKGKDSKNRGFAYIELNSEEEYEKAFSMHHTFIKGRQIKVQYTKPGNKNSEQAKKEIKVKNAKLHAMRKEGKLAGSVKQSQKRSFRRKKAAQYSAGAGDA